MTLSPSWLQSAIDKFKATFTLWNTDAAGNATYLGLAWPAKGSANWHKDLQMCLQQLDLAQQRHWVALRDSGNTIATISFLAITPSGHVTTAKATAAARLAGISRPQFFSVSAFASYEIDFAMRPGGLVHLATGLAAGGWAFGDRVYLGTDGLMARDGGTNFPAESGAEIWDCGCIFRQGGYDGDSYDFLFSPPVLIEVIA